MFSVITPLALGWIAGTVLQLQQPQLWAGEVYWAFGATVLAIVFAVVRVSRVLLGTWVHAAVGLVFVAALSAVLVVVRPHGAAMRPTWCNVSEIKDSATGTTYFDGYLGANCLSLK